MLDDAITYYVYANSHILVYPIPGATGRLRAGERLINVVWYRNYLAGDDLDDLLVDANGIRTRSVGAARTAARRTTSPKRVAVAAARLPPAIAEVVLRGRRPLRAGGARSRRATDGFRPRLFARRCGIRRSSTRGCRYGQGCRGCVDVAQTLWPPIPMTLPLRWLRGNLVSSNWDEVCKRGHARSGGVRRSTGRGAPVIPT